MLSTVNVYDLSGNKNVSLNTIAVGKSAWHWNNSALLLASCQQFSVSGFHFCRIRHQNLRFAAVFSSPALLQKLCFFLLGVGKKFVHFDYIYRLRFISGLFFCAI